MPGGDDPGDYPVKPPMVNPLDLDPDGLCCCLQCRSILRHLPMGWIRPIRPDIRPRLRARWPELMPNIFAVWTQEQDHRC